MDIGVTRTRGATIALVAAVCLVAMNMRPTITAVGPLLDEIGTDTGLAIATLGLLASVPLAAWAIVSPFAHDLSQRFGMSRVVLWSLLLLTLGTAVRSLPGPTASLWIGTVLIGVALAVANVLMPAVVKRDFGSRVPLVMALYTGLLGGFGAIASGVAVPVSQIPLGGEPAGWRFSLLVTGGALLLPAIAVWAWATRGRGHGSGRGRSRERTGIWTDPVAWVVAAYMGLQSAAFYMQVTWLAAIATSTGHSAIAAGVDVMIYQIAAVGGALALPFALRGRAEALAPALLPILGIVGLSGLILAPTGITGWIILTGLCSGASLGMSLTLMAQRARDHDGASALSGMSQSVGYVVAALGPPVFGWLHAITAGWLAPLVLLIGVLVGQGIVGILAGRERFVLEHR